MRYVGRVLAPLLFAAALAFPFEGPQFDRLVDLHIAVYDPDFAWQRRWEEARYARSGLEVTHGSISQHELYTGRALQLNVPLLPQAAGAPDVAPSPPSSPLWLRYEHAETGSPDALPTSDRIELAVTIAGPLAITVSGWPEYVKSSSSAGAGLLLTGASRRDYLAARVQLEAPFFNQRTRLPARYEGEPLRVVAEGNLERGALRVWGAVDWSNEARLVFDDPAGSEGVRDHASWMQRTEEKLEWTPSGSMLLGVRHGYLGRGDARRYFPGYVDPERALADFDFISRRHRVDAYLDTTRGAWRFRAQTGLLAQRDVAVMTFVPGYDFVKTEWISGARAYWNGAAPGLSLGFGYWGNVVHSDRRVDDAPTGRPAPWVDRRDRGYADKGDLSIGYVLPGERFRVEGILSHEITGGRFGGGCVRAQLLF